MLSILEGVPKIPPSMATGDPIFGIISVYPLGYVHTKLYIFCKSCPNIIKIGCYLPRYWVGGNGCTERKKWSRTGSRVEPFSCPQDGPHLGTVLVPLWSEAPFFSQTWLLRKKWLLLKSGAVFQNGSRVEPFWLHYFYVWVKQQKV